MPFHFCVLSAFPQSRVCDAVNECLTLRQTPEKSWAPWAMLGPRRELRAHGVNNDPRVYGNRRMIDGFLGEISEGRGVG